MVEASERELLELIVSTLEGAVATQTGLTRAIQEMRELVTDHGDSLVALSNRIDSNYRAVRPLLASKAQMTSMVCGRCGSSYATEDGPELCGPCWVKLGMPDEWTPPRASRA